MQLAMYHFTDGDGKAVDELVLGHAMLPRIGEKVVWQDHAYLVTGVVHALTEGAKPGPLVGQIHVECQPEGSVWTD